MDPQKVSPDNIWQYRQNRPDLIARDFEEHGIPKAVSLRILMARGVFKWLSVRRALIKTKDTWKTQITNLHNEYHSASPSRRLEIRGELKALNQCREQVRALCHSERWQFVDIDRESKGVLEQ